MRVQKPLIYVNVFKFRRFCYQFVFIVEEEEVEDDDDEGGGGRRRKRR